MAKERWKHRVLGKSVLEHGQDHDDKGLVRTLSLMDLRTKSEKKREAYLLGPCHVQAPYGGNWYDQDHQIGDDVDDGGTYEDIILVQTCTSFNYLGWFPYTFGGDGQDQSQGVEQVVPENRPDGPPNATPEGWVNDEKASVEQQDGCFGEEHSDASNDFNVVEELS
ncbi:MAG: hypothetical protein Q9223_005507 [Gallowayella weberi]